MWCSQKENKALLEPQTVQVRASRLQQRNVLVLPTASHCQHSTRRTKASNTHKKKKKECCAQQLTRRAIETMVARDGWIFHLKPIDGCDWTISWLHVIPKIAQARKDAVIIPRRILHKS